MRVAATKRVDELYGFKKQLFQGLGFPQKSFVNRKTRTLFMMFQDYSVMVTFVCFF